MRYDYNFDPSFPPPMWRNQHTVTGPGVVLSPPTTVRRPGTYVPGSTSSAPQSPYGGGYPPPSPYGGGYPPSPYGGYPPSPYGGYPPSPYGYDSGGGGLLGALFGL